MRNQEPTLSLNTWAFTSPCGLIRPTSRVQKMEQDSWKNHPGIPWEKFVKEDILMKITYAIAEGSIPHLESALRSDPKYLTKSELNNNWISHAIQDDDLPMIKALVQHGFDINFNNEVSPETYHAYTPEGPMWLAANTGQYETVKWMLENGAKVNYEVRGQIRCKPLQEAARFGHLEVVKLLIEHGAALNSISNGVNPLMEARYGGHDDVIEYLESLGMRDLREITPPDFQSAHVMLLKEAGENWGTVADWTYSLPTNPEVTVHLAIPDKEWQRKTQENYDEWGWDEAPNRFRTLFTIGMSDIELRNPAKTKRYTTELFLHLPDDWPLDESALNDPQWNWPLKEMERIIKNCFDTEVWADGNEAVMMNGDPPQSFNSETKLCGWLIILSSDGYKQASDYRFIGFRLMSPIYLEEEQLIESEDHYELLEKFDRCGIPTCIAMDRPNMVTEFPSEFEDQDNE